MEESKDYDYQQSPQVLAMQVDDKSVKAAIAKVVGRSRQDYSDLTQEELHQTCVNLGFKMSPYLAVEAHLVACGGYQTEGKGKFDIKKLIAWLHKRSVKVMPKSPDYAAELVNKERYSSLRSSVDSVLLLPSLNKKRLGGGARTRAQRNAAVIRSIDATRQPERLIETASSNGVSKLNLQSMTLDDNFENSSLTQTRNYEATTLPKVKIT